MYNIREETRLGMQIIFITLDEHPIGYISIPIDPEFKKQLNIMIETLNNAKIPPADIRSTN